MQQDDRFDDDQYGDNSYSSDENNPSVQYQQSPQQLPQVNPNNQNQTDSQPDDQNGSFESEDQRLDMKIIEQPTNDQPNQKRITSPFLTKYEKARIIGVRAVQISKNSPLYLTADSKSLEMWDPLTIAEKQLAQQAIPFIIRRYLPDGSFQDWKLSELKTLD